MENTYEYKKNRVFFYSLYLYVTEKVYDKVNNGESFRDAYLEVKEEWFKKS